MEIQFFSAKDRHWTSFGIFVVTKRVTNFLPKLVNMLLFSAEKTFVFPISPSPFLGQGAEQVPLLC